MNVRSGGRLAGAALVTFAAICFGTLGPVTRFAAAAGVEALPLVTWRAAIGALLVGSVMAFGVIRGRAVSVELGAVPLRQRASMLGGVLAGATVNLGIFLAFLRVSIALTLLLFYLYPTLVAVVSAARFGEPFGRRRVVALSASLFGLVLVFGGAGSLGTIDPIGVGLACLAAVAQMLYVLGARHGFGSIPSAQAAAITMGGGALVYLAIAGAVGSLPSIAEPLANPAGLAVVVYAGTIGAGLPTLAFVMGIRRLGPPRAAILSTLEPVVGVLLATALLAEVPTPLQLLGGALVIAGGVLSQLGSAEPAAEHEAVAEADAGA